MAKDTYKSWRILQTIELSAAAADVWAVVGFYTIHTWHPDIENTEIPKDQTKTTALRRELTFPGQSKTIEELLVMDNINFHYRYKWYQGEWGEKVKDYVAEIRVFDIDMKGRSIVQWSSTFLYTEDAISEFYLRGFDQLTRLFDSKFVAHETTGKKTKDKSKDKGKSKTKSERSHG